MARVTLHVALLLGIIGTVGGCGAEESGGSSPPASSGASSSTGGGEGANECPTGQALCGGVCTTLATDPLNCGSCARGCADGQICVDSVCLEGDTGTGGSAAGGAGATGGISGSGGVDGTGAAGGSSAASGVGASSGTGGSQIGGSGGTGGNQIGGSGGDQTGGTGATGGSGGEQTGGSGGDQTGGTGGSGGTAGSMYDCPAPNPNLFAIGMDLSFQGASPAASRSSLLETYKQHGINYVRLRTFVDPMAADGYDQTSGSCGLEETIDFGRQVKDACMGLLVDFHYSDNWADPGKQCVPVPWQGYATIDDMATALYDYTRDAIEQLIAGGARPDMVQIGNEITPGILIHLCDGGGLPYSGIAGYNAMNGALYFWSSTDNGAPPAGGPSPGGWTNLGILLNAAASGVKDVDAGIKIALHLDRCNELGTSRTFIENATSQGVPFDVFGESCYGGAQGQPSDWEATFTSLASSFPDLELMIAEYAGQERAANDVIFDLPGLRGIGTFSWSPSTAPATMAIYDQMAIDYASRL